MNSIVIPVTEQYKDRFTVENGSLVLQKVQPNDTGRYHLKFHDTKSTEEIELTVTAVTKSVTPDPLAGSFPTTVEPESITLDPDTAHTHLIVSENKKTVRYSHRTELCKNCNRRFQFPAVRGQEGFTAGKHYCEVEVGEKIDLVSV
nr:PREDICTED: tripartite motif-containing protein 60-like isoform X2 [Latimeria chalumnae]|eukprot:XP_014354434.1 PREDICTED: tripartite motif-containing protein 60-like isoform X2 [Latimeria chalumnae]